MGTESLSWG